MAEWVGKLDAFLRFNERNILSHAGTISHELAEQHAHEQFEKYEQKRLVEEAARPTSDFDKLVDKSKKIGKQLPAPKGKKGAKRTSGKRRR